MYEDSFLTPIRALNCFIHKKQKATHICTDLHCTCNPIMCALCLTENKFRSNHSSHEQSVRPINEAIDSIAAQIKSQIKSVDSIYQKTIGHRDNALIKANLDKADYLGEEIQNRIESIKVQVDLEMDLLNKQFQRQMLLEKQQFIRRLDDYRKKFFTNMETLKKESSDLTTFQSSLKFYSNPNSLLLKLSTEAQKRSIDWFIQQKKVLSRISRLDPSSFSHSTSTLNNYINRSNQMNMMLKPVWIGLKKQLQSQRQLKSWIRTNLESWVSLPDLKDLSHSLSQNSGSGSSSKQDYRSTYSPLMNYNSHPYSSLNNLPSLP